MIPIKDPVRISVGWCLLSVERESATKKANVTNPTCITFGNIFPVT